MAKETYLHFCVRDYDEEKAWSIIESLKRIYVKPTENVYESMVMEKEFYNLFGTYVLLLANWYIGSSQYYMKFYKILDNAFGKKCGGDGDRREREELLFKMLPYMATSFIANDYRVYAPNTSKIRLDIPMDGNLVRDIQGSMNYIARRPRYYMCTKRDNIDFYNSGEVLINTTILRSIMIDLKSGCDGFDELGSEITGFVYFRDKIRHAQNLLLEKKPIKRGF